MNEKYTENNSLLAEIEKIEADWESGVHEGFIPIAIAAHLLTIDVGDPRDPESADDNCLALTRATNLLIGEVSKGQLNAYDRLTLLPILEVCDTNVHEEELCVDWTALLEQRQFAGWIKNSLPDSFWGDVGEGSSEDQGFSMNEPKRKDDWFYCIRDHAISFHNKFNKLPTEPQLWNLLIQLSDPTWNLGISGKRVVLGEKAIDREAFSKRFSSYFSE
ncbi:MAG: hypothetical protein RPU32_12525 [Candidatus Sedimenticola sp. (ex Thyasira tokunagai)]